MKLARAALAMLAAAIGLGAAPAQERTTLIRGARVFDGTGAPASVQDVLVQGDRITAVGQRLRTPRGARVVDARGLTLIPGLHDLHTHLRAPGFDAPDDLPKAYAAYLVNGVTSVNDFSMSGEMLAPVREMTGQGSRQAGVVPAPNLQLAIRLGVPGGHGTEYGWGPFFTLQATTPAAAEAAMARALPYRPDVIKVFADGWRYGRRSDLNSMDQATLAAIVRRAHAADTPVITHTVTLQGAKLAAAAGVDALGHGIGDALVDDQLVTLMKASGTAYVPTMAVYEPPELRRYEAAEWRKLRPPERERETRLGGGGANEIPEVEARRWTILQENVRRMKAGGVRIGIGTDAGVGGVYHGSSTIREIRLLTLLGHTPAEALAAATSVSAGILRKGKDRGRIAAGQRADLVLTGGRPDERINDLYDVRHVFVRGREMALAPLARSLEEPGMSPLPLRRMTGAIDTGAGPAGRTDLDTLPVESHEAGVDHSHLDHRRQQPDKRLFLYAQMGGSPRPFAQLTLPLTRGAVQLADARGFTGIAFDARGAGRYELLFDSYGIHPRGWFETQFEAGETRRELRIPFSSFRSPDAQQSLDLARLRGLIVRLEGEPGGKAWLELGNLRFY